MYSKLGSMSAQRFTLKRRKKNVLLYLLEKLERENKGAYPVHKAPTNAGSRDGNF